MDRGPFENLICAASYISSSCPQRFRHVQHALLQHVDMMWAVDIEKIIQKAAKTEKPINELPLSGKRIHRRSLSPLTSFETAAAHCLTKTYLLTQKLLHKCDNLLSPALKQFKSMSNHPQIIQGGMGAGVSNWRLARAVSKQGQLGVVSGVALDIILARRLQDGDPGGHMRHALDHFPFPEMA